MRFHALIARAAAPTVEAVHAIKPDQLDAPTPCGEWDLRKLINHLLFWGPSLEAAARKESVPPPAAGEQDVDLAAGDWAGRLDAHFDRLVAAWREPAAWDGMTAMGGPQQFPAAVAGGMALGELVVHGWDLARAIDHPIAWDDEVLQAAYQVQVQLAEQGRDMGVYGPAVPVPDGAPLLDRTLGLSGRDPHWRP